MAVKWTDEQQKVIDLRNRNILVSAAAGSGKTAVLVERIITMLTDDEHPMDVDRLLIVTFTEAAAAEMKERIRNAIEHKLLEQPENEHLMQQSMLIHNAQITTIHSFCLSVIRDHFHAIDIDPGFRVGEEGELKLMRHDVLDELLEERYADGAESFTDLAFAYGGRNDKKLEELVLKIYEFARSYPDMDEWLDSCIEAYQITTEEELEERFFIKLVKENVGKLLNDATGLIDEALHICMEPDGPYEYEKTLEKDREVLEQLKEAETYAQMWRSFQCCEWSRLATKRDKSVSQEKTDQVKAIREDYKGYVKDLTQQYFYQSPKAMIKDFSLCTPFVRELISLIKDFAKKFETKKRAQNMIDFSDMEQYALQILRVPEIAAEYQEQFEEIMIDEYQDSNLIQEAILTSISRVSAGEYNIFMVGDVKQSIYRFRLSRPELFMEKYDRYDLTDGKEQRIDLHKNFRSREEVLSSVNFLFCQIMTRELGGIEYDSSVALNVGASFEEGEEKETEVLLIDTKDVSGSEAAGKTAERVLEAKVIASKIRELMEKHQIVDKATGEYRHIRYSDIVILTRSISGFVESFVEQLNKEGIPTYAGTREGYFSTQEIGIVLSYLKVLDNRRQDIPLTAVLTSGIGQMTEKDLAVIKSDYKEIPFYQAVVQYRECGSDGHIREKLDNCIGKMDEFRRIVPYTPIQELLWKILEETGYGDYVSAMPGGEQRKANIEMLIEKARAFESTSYKGLFHFVRYMEQLQKYNVDYGEASMEDEQSDNVRIMTIHKSKGLEFPIVFVAGMGKGFNMQDARSSVALHARLGIGLDAMNVKARTKSSGLLKRIIQREETLDTLGEELRVLYVALTRAKEKLIITGTISGFEKKVEVLSYLKARKKVALSYGMISKATSYWGWVLPALMRLSEEIPIRISHITSEDMIEQDVKHDTMQEVKKTQLLAWDTDRTYNEEVQTQIKEQFSYTYPFSDSVSQKLKFTVSELKKLAYDKGNEEETGEVLYEKNEVIPLLPKFMQEEEILTGAGRGTAYHRLLELLDFTKAYDYHSLKQEMAAFVENGRMTEEAVNCMRIKDIISFLDSSAGTRMQNSAKKGMLYKEQPFVLGVDKEGELILVQGIIDVYFEEEDGLVVLDYKTDKVREAQELVDRYQAQLDYYAKALEQITHKKVKEKIIYSFTLQEEISL